MATVTVSKQFAENFKLWSEDQVSCGNYTAAEMAGMKDMIRIELGPGKDQFRAGCSILNAMGVEVPAAIDDQAKRVALWDGFFASEADQIRKLWRKAA